LRHIGFTNYLAVPDLPLDSAMTDFDLPGGVIFEGKLDQVYAIKSHTDPRLPNGVTVSVPQAWYEGEKTFHPWKGETNPHYTGFQDDGKYTWVNSPRFEGHPMQVGPLAQLLIGYALGHKLTQKWAGEASNRTSAISRKQVSPAMPHSTLDRIAARAIRASNIASGDAKIYLKPPFGEREVHGAGFHQAPRGALWHWVAIKNGQIANYQAVVPTTWNAGPRDEHGTRGPYEASLLGQPRRCCREAPGSPPHYSFDPCLACAIHAFDPQGKEVISVSEKR
jgi:hydrogenase large subunit